MDPTDRRIVWVLALLAVIAALVVMAARADRSDASASGLRYVLLDEEARR